MFKEVFFSPLYTNFVYIHKCDLNLFYKNSKITYILRRNVISQNFYIVLYYIQDYVVTNIKNIKENKKLLYLIILILNNININ